MSGSGTSCSRPSWTVHVPVEPPATWSATSPRSPPSSRNASAEFQQPRPDDGAVVPRSRDGLEVEVVAALVEQLEALAVRLHEGVLDAVVDHLHVVPAARGPHAVVALGPRGDGVEDGHQFVVGPLRAADHQREAQFGARRPAASAAVEVGELVGFRAARGVLEVAVAAVDDDVLAPEVGREFLERGVHGVARGHHQPDALLVAEFVGKRGQRVGGGRASARGVLAGVRVDVEGDHVVAGVETAVDDDAPHAAEADDSQFHTVNCRAQ